jgi:ABC-type oligopeptide transport system ATPase subunit
MHTYILGGSGSGKSTLLKQLALEEIKNGHAVIFFDPHGQDVDELMKHVPRKRIKDTVLFDPTDPTHYLAWNPLEGVSNIPLTATSLSDAIKDAWGYHGMTTPVMDMFLYFTIETLIRNNVSFFDSLALLLDSRDVSLSGVSKTFWDHFEKMTPKERRDATASTLNKLFVLFGDERMGRLFSTRKGHYSLRTDQILFVRLPQGQLGLSKVSLIGSVLLSLIHVASLSRDPSQPLSIYIDECHHFSYSTIAEMFSGLRKFNVHLTVAHQYIAQVKPELFSSLMGNCERRLVFRVSEEDAQHFQDCKKNGPTCLHELETFRYRTFPWYTTDHDSYATPLPAPVSDMADRVRLHTHENYCRGIQ